MAKTTIQGSSFHSYFFGPLAQSQSKTLKSEMTVTSSIGALLLMGSPATVFGRVRSIVVDSFDGANWRWFCPHVGKKCGEIMNPPFANINTATTVIWIILVIFITASTLHVAPSLIFRSMFPTVGCESFDNEFFLKASTGLRPSGSEIATSEAVHGAAITTAFPEALPQVTKSCQPAEFLAVQEYKRHWHDDHCIWNLRLSNSNLATTAVPERGHFFARKEQEP